MTMTRLRLRLTMMKGMTPMIKTIIVRVLFVATLICLGGAVLENKNKRRDELITDLVAGLFLGALALAVKGW